MVRAIEYGKNDSSNGLGLSTSTKSLGAVWDPARQSPV